MFFVTKVSARIAQPMRRPHTYPPARTPSCGIVKPWAVQTSPYVKMQSSQSSGTSRLRLPQTRCIGHVCRRNLIDICPIITSGVDIKALHVVLEHLYYVFSADRPIIADAPPWFKLITLEYCDKRSSKVLPIGLA